MSSGTSGPGRAKRSNSFSCLAYSSGKVTHEVRVEVEDNAGSVIYTLDP